MASIGSNDWLENDRIAEAVVQKVSAESKVIHRAKDRVSQSCIHLDDDPALREYEHISRQFKRLTSTSGPPLRSRSVIVDIALELRAESATSAWNGDEQAFHNALHTRIDGGKLFALNRRI